MQIKTRSRALSSIKFGVNQTNWVNVVIDDVYPFDEENLPNAHKMKSRSIDLIVHTHHCADWDGRSF